VAGLCLAYPLAQQGMRRLLHRRGMVITIRSKGTYIADIHDKVTRADSRLIEDSHIQVTVGPEILW
jgi:hypothetical protein